MADTWSAAPKTIGSRRTAAWSSPDNRFSSRLTHLRRSAGPHWTIGWCQTPLPVLPVWHTGRSVFEAGALSLHERMLPLIDLTLWLLTTLVEAFVVYLFLIRGLFRKFLFLNFYLLLSASC